MLSSILCEPISMNLCMTLGAQVTTLQQNLFALHLYATLISSNPLQQPRQRMVKAAWLQSQGIGSRAWTPMPSIVSLPLGYAHAISRAGEAKMVFESFCKPKKPRGLIQGMLL